MRTAFSGVLVLTVVGLAAAQPKEPADAPPDWGIKERVKQYPQATPKDALRSVVGLIEKGDYTYLVAHVLDPEFVKAQVAVRAARIEDTVNRELTQVRDFQRANLSKIAPEALLPTDPVAFRRLVLARARERAFRQLVKDVEQKITDDPLTVKDIRKILRGEGFTVGDSVATAAHADVKGRVLYFKKVGERWYLENRAEVPKKDP